jgi:hypothetical protein
MMTEQLTENFTRPTTSTSIESGLDFILSHLEKPHFPRRISTYLTEKNGPWQVLVNSREEALAKFKDSNLLNCRISAYRFPVPVVRDINTQVPNFFMSDLDRKNFKTNKLLQQCLQDTLKNFRDKLHGANPSVLWSGGGYHLLQPLDADIILEMENIFANFNEPSRGFMRYAEKLMTDNKADSVHSSTVSFGNCMVRVPGSYNAKYIQKNDNGKVVLTPQSEVIVVHPWDGYTPNIKWLLRDYWIYLIQEKNNDAFARLHRDQKKLRSEWKRGIYPNQYQQANKIEWIESLYRKPLDDFRRYCIWRIFVPYFINIMRLPQSETSDLIKDWVDRCSLLRRLDFSPKDNIDYALKTVRDYRPIGEDQLRVENDGRFYSLLKMEGIVN